MRFGGETHERRRLLGLATDSAESWSHLAEPVATASIGRWFGSGVLFRSRALGGRRLFSAKRTQTTDQRGAARLQQVFAGSDDACGGTALGEWHHCAYARTVQRRFI
jgi:hypothetical protein